MWIRLYHIWLEDEEDIEAYARTLHLKPHLLEELSQKRRCGFIQDVEFFRKLNISYTNALCISSWMDLLVKVIFKQI